MIFIIVAEIWVLETILEHCMPQSADRLFAATVLFVPNYKNAKFGLL